MAVKQVTVPVEMVDSGPAASISSEFRREVWLMSGLKHRNFVQLFGVSQSPLCFVMVRASNLSFVCVCMCVCDYFCSDRILFSMFYYYFFSIHLTRCRSTVPRAVSRSTSRRVANLIGPAVSLSLRTSLTA